MNMQIFKNFLVTGIFAILLLGEFGQVGQASGSGNPQLDGECSLVETTLPWPPDLHRALSESLCHRHPDILPGDDRRLIITSLDILGDGSYATATVVMRPETMPEDYESLLLFPSRMVVMHREVTGWHVALEGTSTFTQIVQDAPSNVFEKGFKELWNDVGTISAQGIPGSLNLKWPWKDGQTWKYTNGPHKWYNETVNSSLDFAPLHAIPAQEREIWATAAGTVVRKCVDAIQSDIILLHTSGYASGYLHIEKNSASHLNIGQSYVGQGDRLGITYNGFNFKDRCGRGDGPHLHFYVGRWSGSSFQFDSIVGTVISGWALNSDGCFHKSGQQRKCPGDQITSDNNSATLISIGQTVNGEINPAGEIDRYYFDGTADQEITIEMTKSSGNLDPYIILYRPNGSYLFYDDDGAGYPNARLVIRLPDSGRYNIRAKSFASHQSGAYILRVTASSSGRDTDDGRWLVHDRWLDGRINPNNDEDWYYFSGIEGRIVSIRMNKSGGNLDSYLELFDPNGSRIAYDDDGGGGDTRNSWLVTVLPRTGNYRLKARSNNHNSSGAYAIRLRMVDSNNYALNRPAYASSVENAVYAPIRAFDGRMDTRWSSRFSDPQWIYVDLGQNRTFDTVILRWETAYARRYGIDVWTGTSWRRVFWTDSGQGGTVMIRFPMTTARYVRMYGLVRGTPWGYSLWEFGVYNSTEATAPIVPPPDPDKQPDNIDPLPPLPLPEEEEGKEVLALYLGHGQDAQEVMALPDEDPGLVLEGTVGREGIPTATIDFVIPGYPGGGVVVYPDQTIEFGGSAVDNDAEGDPGIFAYEWRSDRDGLLSTQQTFKMTAASLSFGEHIISFRAQDNEGNWSEWEQIHIQVRFPYQIYLPLIMRSY